MMLKYTEQIIRLKRGPLRMGYFFGLIVSQLEEVDAKLRQITEVMHFDQRTYISWESTDIPSNKWLSKGSKTLFVKKGIPRFERIEYPQEFTLSPIVEGVVRKHKIFRFKTSFSGFEQQSLFHLVLPECFVPEMNTLNAKPESIIKRQNRLAITWTFTDSICVDFVLKKVGKEEFAAFKSAGSPVRIRFDSTTLQKIKSKADEKIENIAAKAVALYLKEQTG